MSYPKDLYARVPVDATAARVASVGPSYVPQKKIASVVSDVPLPTRRVDRSVRENLTGYRRGSLTVIGLSRDTAGVWVCRCVCGHYVTRRAKSIKNPANTIDACEFCRHVQYLRRASTFRTTGQND